MPARAADSAPAQAALEMRGVVKRFGAAIALDGASLVVRRGTIHALLGENGAGKTTLMRIAFGELHPDAGDVLIEGAPVRFLSPRDAREAGVGMVHQHFTHVPAMTVAENVALGGRGRFRPGHARAVVRQTSREAGLPLDPDALASDLPVGAQQRLELVKALAGGARVLILDEPTAVLAPSESEDLMAHLRAFTARGGSVVLITHKLQEVLRYADEATVLRQGRTIATARAGETTADELANAMLGTAPPAEPKRVAGKPGSVVARLESVTVRDSSGRERLRGASASVHEREIVGIAAAEGSGYRELLRVLAGRMLAASGRVEIPADVAFIPEDRQNEALILDFSAVENIALRDAARMRGVVRWNEIEARTGEALQRGEVRGASPGDPVRKLSGGNQQKLVLAREMSPGARLVVAEDPSRGLDVRAAREVHGALLAAAERGAAVVVHFSDLDETLALADRMLVVFDGRVREVEKSRDAVARAMLGAEAGTV